MAEVLVVEGADEVINKIYKQLMVSQGANGADTDMTKALKREVRRVLSQVQKEMRNKAKASMKSDPRKAAQGVKKANWRKEIGGSVSLFNPKTASKREVVVANTRSHSGRGGNRRTRSVRTNQVDGYYGQDRAFILRFLNQGTTNRNIDFTPQENPKRPGSRTVRKNTGSRGSISARGFFRDADGVMRARVGEMTEALEKFINSVGTM